MKNLLSENLLRFGVKNLTESAKKELIVKSIMETIDQHGLRNVIKNKLTEQDPNIPTADDIVVRPKMQDAGNKPLPGFAKGSKLRLGTLRAKQGPAVFKVQAPGVQAYEPEWTINDAYSMITYDANGQRVVGAYLTLTNSELGALKIVTGAGNTFYNVSYTPAPNAKKYEFPVGTFGTDQAGPIKVVDNMTSSLLGIAGSQTNPNVYSKSPISAMKKAIQVMPKQ